MHAILEDLNERPHTGAPAGPHDAMPDACWVVKCGFLCTDVGGGNIGSAMACATSRACAESDMAFREAEEGKSARCARREGWA